MLRLPWQEKSLTRNEEAMDKIYTEIESLEPHSDEYTIAVKNLVALHQLQPQRNLVNANTVLTVAGYVLVAGAVLSMEVFGHSITSRVGSLALPKPKL